MTAQATAQILPGRSPGFAPRRPWDRNAFLILFALATGGILIGFAWDVVNHFKVREPPYALVVHFHAAAFVGWLALTWTQLLLVRTGHVALHRRLGLAGVCLAATMPPLGWLATVAVQRQFLHLPGFDPAFISVNITALTGFAGLVAAGVWLRKDAAAHKRLMLLTFLYLSSAGFSRWWTFAIDTNPGVTPLRFFDSMFLVADLLILDLGAYDLATRRRLHPAYMGGLAWIAANEAVCVWLYFMPWWKPITLGLIGR